MALFDENTNPIDQECSVSLLDIVPPHYFDEDTVIGGEEGETKKVFESLNLGFNIILNSLDNIPNIIDASKTEVKYLDLLMSNVGFEPTIALSERRKRKLIPVIVKIYQFTGTKIGIENVIRQYLGIDARVMPFTDGWVLNENELGVDTYLHPSDDNPRGFYTFDIEVNALLSDEEVRIIREIVSFMQPSHTHLRDIIEIQDDPFLLLIEGAINRCFFYLRDTQQPNGGWILV